MTIICALHDPETRSTWVGCDTVALFQGLKNICPPKFILAGRWAVGVAGDARGDTLVRWDAAHIADLEKPEQVVQRLRELIIADEFKSLEGEGAKGFSTDYVLANNEAVWAVCGAFSMDRVSDGQMYAAGSATHVARGADHVLRSMQPEDRVHGAVAASIAIHTGCGGEPWIHELTADADRK